MFLFVIVAEGVDLVYDFGRIFQKVVRPYVAPDDETLDQALNRLSHIMNKVKCLICTHMVQGQVFSVLS